jgi:NADPH:quinone reductase-like Zn-dependent oxidoreductase
MKAVVQVGYGSADVLELKEIDRPVANHDDVLVRVQAASLAAGDYFGMRGVPFPIRMYVGFPRPKKDYVVGVDLAGRVEAVGKNVTRFKPGDEVFSGCSRACAEYTCAKEDQLVPKPNNLTFEQAAAETAAARSASSDSPPGTAPATASGRRRRVKPPAIVIVRPCPARRVASSGRGLPG